MKSLSAHSTLFFVKALNYVKVSTERLFWPLVNGPIIKRLGIQITKKSESTFLSSASCIKALLFEGYQALCVLLVRLACTSGLSDVTCLYFDIKYLLSF